MATRDEIAQLDRAIIALADGYTEQFRDLFNEFLVQWSQLADPFDRVAVFGLLADLRNNLAEFIDASDTVSTAMIQLNGGGTGLETTVAEFKSQIYLANSIAIEEEVNSIFTLILLGGAALAAAIILEQRSRTQVLDRIRMRFDQSLLALTGEITRVLGAEDPAARFRYVGGVIANTRPFCAKHNNKVYSLQEIEEIWSGSWEGKAPGDPFSTRGGYNCRHIWIKESSDASS